MITIQTFVFNDLQVNTYVLNDETLNTVIIDPACQTKHEKDMLSDYILSCKLNPVAICLTHGHVDHIVGINYCLQKYSIPFQMHRGDSFLLKMATETGLMFGLQADSVSPPEKYIEDGDKIYFGNSMLEAIHVPGHSPGSIVFHSSSDGFIIAGDVLFCGSIGRSDFPGGNYEILIEGIKQKLLTLPPSTIVYPGHGPSTTILAEHDTNPFLI